MSQGAQDAGMIRPDPGQDVMNQSDAFAVLRNLRESLYRHYGNYQTADRLLKNMLNELSAARDSKMQDALDSGGHIKW